MIEILNKILTGKPIYHKDGYGEGEKKKRSFSPSTRDFKVYTLEEVNRMKFNLKIKFDTIPEKLYNKKFSVGDYTIHFQYNLRFEPIVIPEEKVTEQWKNKSGSDYVNESRVVEDYWCVILEYKGTFRIIGKARNREYIEINYINNRRFGNWWKKASDYPDDRRCILEDYSSTLEFRYFNELTLELLKEIPDDVVLTDSELDLQPYYEFDNKGKKLSHYHNPDYKWFIEQELKDGVYKPSKPLINLAYLGDDWDNEYQKPKNRNLLKDLGVHTIQFRTKDHFPVTTFFDIDGIELKAPKTVINLYDYSHFVKDEKMLLKLKEEKAEIKRKAEVDKYNDTFTLVFHGKELFKDCSSSEIISYLENKSNKDTQKTILDNFKIIFDIYEDIDSFELATFGTHYANELAGESHYSTECRNEDIEKETLDEIYELYQDNLVFPDRDYLDLVYGRPERGAMLIGVRRKGKKLEIYTEDYDLN